MSNKKCSNCYYSELCDGGKVCSDYFPVDERVIDEEVDYMIERRREAFRSEWAEYIEKFNS